MTGRRYVVAQLSAGLLLAACRTAGGDSARPAPLDAVLPAARVPSTPRAAEVEAEVEVEAPLEAEVEATPEPEPEIREAPLPFEGRQQVRVEELFAELDHVADEMAALPTVRADYDAMREAKGLADSDALYRDYVRVKLAFEATRDGGLWHLRWDITNQSPNSDRIWSQWKQATVPDPDAPRPTAIAECDELSALFAFVAHNLGVRHVGLFWPQWNHVVAVWTVQSDAGAPVRIVVPTSQIFLDDAESLGTDGFDPWTQKKIFEYRRRDVKGSHRIDAELARFFVVQARRDAGRSQAELQRARNERTFAMATAADALN